MRRKREPMLDSSTPLLVLGLDRYSKLEAQARKALIRAGWNGKGVPALVFDGPGGVFVAVQGMEQS